MPKNQFAFKQFTISQEKCAMKVCTDSCILGASVYIPPFAGRVLDIGSGTGLLALMIAQRCNAIIDAVEIEEGASQQCYQNFNQSPWKSRFNIYHTSIQEYLKNIQVKYDLIVCNPPFYSNNLLAESNIVNIAYHSQSLSHKELINCAINLLNPGAIFTVMLPYYESEQFNREAEKNGLWSIGKQIIKNNINASPLRVISYFSMDQQILEFPTEIIIRDEEGNYSANFISLLKEYYLKF